MHDFRKIFLDTMARFVRPLRPQGANVSRVMVWRQVVEDVLAYFLISPISIAIRAITNIFIGIAAVAIVVVALFVAVVSVLVLPLYRRYGRRHHVPQLCPVPAESLLPVIDADRRTA